MIILIGLIVLAAAMVVGIAGVLANDGPTHTIAGHFSVLGYHRTGSTGMLFLAGIIVGVLALGGLMLLLSGARRTARRGRTARRELRQARRDAAAATSERDELIARQQGETASAASTPPRAPAAPIPTTTATAAPPTEGETQTRSSP